MNTTTPVHPGLELWSDWFSPMNVTVSAAAIAVGVSRKTMSEIVNGRAAITADMSVRLSKALGTSPDMWALKQVAFDVATVNRRRLQVRRLVPTTGKDGGR